MQSVSKYTTSGIVSDHSLESVGVELYLHLRDEKNGIYTLVQDTGITPSNQAMDYSFRLVPRFAQLSQ
jgi:hypothetical protein